MVGLGAAGCNRAPGSGQLMPSPSDPARHYVEQLLPTLDAELRQQAEAVATREALQKLVDAQAALPWRTRSAGGIKYADLLQRLYPERAFRKAFVQSDGLTPRGRAILTVLLGADHHAMDPTEYHVERVQALDARLARQADGEPHWETIKLNGAEANRLVAWLGEQKLDPGAPATRQRLLSALVGASLPVPVAAPAVDNDAKKSAKKPTKDTDTPDAASDTRAEVPALLPSPAPRITEHMGKFLEAFKKDAELTAELELRVADGALRYARDMRHFNLAREDWRDLRSAGGSVKLIYGRLEDSFNQLSAADEAHARQLMEALPPAHPQYQKLLEARARYQAIAAQGGWVKVGRTALAMGTKSAAVGALRERLAAEGFLARVESEAPNVVDDALVEAVKDYQITHQFRGDGQPDDGFWRSLNVPVERRIQQIELSIQRWRETQYRGETDYIMVNIPDFHAEVFKDNERTMRFKVVVGNNKRVCDPKKKKWTYPQATPIMMAALDHVIVNPYWYVPQSIITHEIGPKMKRDPKYLEKHGYEVVKLNGREAIRQVPGPDNALGKVKFIFPNAGNIYMHDTPTKRYFDFPLRAFSHGCVRVHEPQKLARYLLENDENGQQYDVEELFESNRQRYVELADKLPVFIEYKTVQIDDQGRPNFLADIYRRDELDLIEDPKAREEYLDCTVRKAPTRDTWEDAHDTAAPAGAERDIGP